MLSNFLKIAFRNLSRQKTLAFINIFGLSTGIACFILLLLYSVNEFSFDRFHKNEKNIYAIYELRRGLMGEDQYDVAMALPMAPTFKKDFPDVLDFVRIRRANQDMLVHWDNESRRIKVSLADPQFFSFFNFPLESGNPSTALQNPNSLVLSVSKAKAFFGNVNPIGKTVQINLGPMTRPFVITAIAKDPPPNSSISFEAMASLYFLQTTPMGEMLNHWYISAFRTYVLLRPGSRLPVEYGRLEQFHHNYNDDGSDINKKTKRLITYGLLPIRAMHTDPRMEGMAELSPVNPITIWIILGIATAILLIACINFTTLAIGRSAGRGKEVGVRKVAGAGKQELMVQFLSEAFLLSLLSTVVGLLLAEFLLANFNLLSGRELKFSLTRYPELGWLLGGLVLVVAILSGIYPAFMLSNFKPIEVLKNKIRMGGSNLFTKSLVTLQFALSTCLIISTIIILQQTSYMTDAYPGFNKENVVVVDASDAEGNKFSPVFKQNLLSRNNILGVASSGATLGEGSEMNVHGFMYKNVHKMIHEYSVDPDYIKVLNMQMVTGRNFDPNISSDTTESVIINEAMMNDFGWNSENVIGQRIEGYTNKFSPVVIGVVKDFNFEPLSKKIQPQLLHQFSGQGSRVFFVRIKPGNPSPALTEIRKAWNAVAPDAPFTYSFLDENLGNYYKSEKRWSNIIGWAGGISIFLACLGLFGLTALSAINRVKEVGIRKVLGASAGSIVGLLSRDFLRLIILAFMIASPLAWYLMSKWLESFAYRIHISWTVFAITGIAVILIALFTISFQTVKAAIVNPVNSLRNE